MNLQAIAGEYAICRLPAGNPWPNWAMAGDSICSVTRTPDELSVVAEQASVPAGVVASRGWTLFRVAGTLPLDAIGIVSGIARILADAKISLACIATHDTDYFLVSQVHAARARDALEQAGYRFTH